MKNLSPDCARLGCLEPDRRFPNRDAVPSPKTDCGDAVGARERSRGTRRRIQHPEVARDDRIATTDDTSVTPGL